MFALYRTAVPFARNLVGNSNVASHGHVSSGLKPSRWMLGMSMTTSSKRKLPEGVEKIIKVKKGPEKPETFWSRFLGPKPMPERHTAAWYREVALICTVFGITGSSTMMLVRPAVKDGLGLEGSFKDGPWSYRLCSLIIMSPVYATLLVLVGTAFGRHAYFKVFAVKIFSRFGIPPELLDKNFRANTANFRKW